MTALTARTWTRTLWREGRVWVSGWGVVAMIKTSMDPNIPKTRFSPLLLTEAVVDGRVVQVGFQVRNGAVTGDDGC